ncbi:MAG: hypothetical protein HY907_17680 [Deltaproteobacteria bacterium]|nr:hypothetical protein [Deltaproteobacteria bacterium]
MTARGRGGKEVVGGLGGATVAVASAGWAAAEAGAKRSAVSRGCADGVELGEVEAVDGRMTWEVVSSSVGVFGLGVGL